MKNHKSVTTKRLLRLAIPGSAIVLLTAGCPLENIKPRPGGGPSAPASQPGPRPTLPAGVTEVDCGTGGCREIVVSGDPEATLPNNSKAPFRGYADPSLRYDARTGTHWLSYSYLSVNVESGSGKPSISFSVRTHLAKSTDKGRSFNFVKQLNTNERATHAANRKQGRLTHEVPTLTQASNGDWHLMWMTYLDPDGPAVHGTGYLSYTSASSPEALGSNVRPFLRGKGEPSVSGVEHDLSRQSGLDDCVTFTEPSLFAHDGKDYLAANCVVFKGRRRPDLEKLGLFRKDGGEYRYLGALLEHDDAKAFSAERMEQGELALARDGKILLLATPQIGEADHLGCYALEVASLEPPRMARNPDGSLVIRAFVTDSTSSEKGPGACTYDPNADTGMIIVRRDFDFRSKPPKMRFSMLETGLHP